MRPTRPQLCEDRQKDHAVLFLRIGARNGSGTAQALLARTGMVARGAQFAAGGTGDTRHGLVRRSDAGRRRMQEDGVRQPCSSESGFGGGGGAKVRTGMAKRSSSRSSGVGAKARVEGMTATFGGMRRRAKDARGAQRFDDGAGTGVGEQVE